MHNLSLTLPADVDDSEEEMVTIDEGTHRGMILSHTIATLPARQWQVLQDSWSRGSFLELARAVASPFLMDSMIMYQHVDERQARAIRRGACRVLGNFYEKGHAKLPSSIEAGRASLRDAEIIVAAIEDNYDSTILDPCAAALGKIAASSPGHALSVHHAGGAVAMVEAMSDQYSLATVGLRVSGFAVLSILVSAHGFHAVDLNAAQLSMMVDTVSRHEDAAGFELLGDLTRALGSPAANSSLLATQTFLRLPGADIIELVHILADTVPQFTEHLVLYNEVQRAACVETCIDDAESDACYDNCLYDQDVLIELNATTADLMDEMSDLYDVLVELVRYGLAKLTAATNTVTNGYNREEIWSAEQLQVHPAHSDPCYHSTVSALCCMYKVPAYVVQ